MLVPEPDDLSSGLGAHTVKGSREPTLASCLLTSTHALLSSTLLIACFILHPQAHNCLLECPLHGPQVPRSTSKPSPPSSSLLFISESGNPGAASVLSLFTLATKVPISPWTSVSQSPFGFPKSDVAPHAVLSSLSELALNLPSISF